MSLLQKLHEIQTEIDSFVKDKKGHNYSYTTGDTVLNKIRPLMNKKGIILKQEVISVENERIDYEVGYGDKRKVKSEMFSSVAQRFTWIDTENDEREECLWHGNGQNDWDKGFGSALTYAERYFLLKFFHVPTDEDDPDTRQGQTSKPKPKNDDKDWLNEADKKRWMKAEKWVKDGNNPHQLRKKFKVSKADMEYFETLHTEAGH